MALFDRRLLAYFDDGLGTGGSMTLLDRITDYQRDLAEIERELSKYQVLLGNRQVQYRHRDRDGWITKNREQKTIKERYRRVAQALGEEDLSVPERVDSQPEQVVEQGRRRSYVSREGHPNSKSRGSRASIQSGSGRPSPAASGKSLTVWVQIDTVGGLSAPRSSAYIVRTSWTGVSDRHLTAETEERPSERDDNGDEKCVVRQQLKLDGHPGSHMVKVSILRRDDGMHLVGDCNIDANDTYNHEVQYHALSDDRGPLFSKSTDDAGRPVPSTVRLRLTHASSAQPAAKSARESVSRPSTSGGKSPRLKAHRESVGSSKAEVRRNSGEDASQRRKNSVARESVEPPKQVVTQDPVVSQRRISGAGSTAAAATAAAATGSAAVAASESLTVDVPASRVDPTPAETPGSPGLSPGTTEGETFEEMIEEEEEEEEEAEISESGEEGFEEGEEEEREGDTDEDDVG